MVVQFLKRVGVFLAVTASGFGIAAEPICAEVKIEILQELTLERQAFEATMRIHNDLDTYALEDIQIDILFSDAAGNDVLATSDSSSSDAKFFINLDETKNLSAVSEGSAGAVLNGQISPKTTGELRWLIIPTAGAAGNQQGGTLYFVGARLEYSYGGKVEVVNVAQDSIAVKPQPKLVLDYFLTQEVIGDDAFTAEIEPPVPYTLGLRIQNTGSGVANNVAIESAQPRIVENDQGLAIGFKITDSYVGNDPAQPTLKMNYGDFEPAETRAGRWVMETTLSGKFTEFTATVSHADELGGELTSLIDSANTHFLIKDVQVDIAGRDNVKDFLAHDNGDYVWVYESETTGLNDTVCDNCALVERMSGTLSAETTSGSYQVRVLTASATADQFGYIRVVDPYQGSKVLVAATRDDGGSIALENAWISQERNADKINFDYFINLFDDNTASAYTLYFVDIGSVAQAPVLQFIPDKTTYEGSSVGFLVKASDVNDDDITLTLNSLPTGASFSDEGSGEGVFQWAPSVGQAGLYPVKFTASDGELSDDFTVQIRVHPANDKDGDGMDDAWEMMHFGTLDRDGTGDFDGDGYSDLDEFINNMDPTVETKAPLVPTMLSPINGSELTSQTPVFSFTNSSHQPEVTTVYELELFDDASYSNLIWSNQNLVEDASGITSDQVLTPLTDNRWFFWRVRAVANEGNSEWVYRSFFVNTQNDAPQGLVLLTPEADAVLTTQTPTLLVYNPQDVDGDSLELDMFVYAFDDTSEPLASTERLALSANGNTQWQPTLDDNLRYLWQVIARDEHGLETASELRAFSINVRNDLPTTPQVIAPVMNSVVTTDTVELVIQNSTDVDNAELLYEFQLDSTPDFSSDNVKRVNSVPAGADGATRWTALFLADSTQYYWRARAFDGIDYSAWVGSQFSVAFENLPPSVPTLLNPIDSAIVETLTPTLVTSAVTDPESDNVTYEFEIYSEFSTLPDARLAAMQSDTASVQVAEAVNLIDAATYYWRARATDSQGSSSAWTPLAEFNVKLPTTVNQPPVFNWLEPLPGQVITSELFTLKWEVTDPDSNASVTIQIVYQNGMTIPVLTTTEDAGVTQLTLNKAMLPLGEFTVVANVTDEVTNLDVIGATGVIAPPVIPGNISFDWDGTELDESQQTTATLSIALDQPLAEGETLTLNYELNDSSEAFIWQGNFNDLFTSGTLTFTAANWSEPQAISVRGKDDCKADGDTEHGLVFTSVLSNASAYADIVTIPLQPLTTRDNEIAEAQFRICEYVVGAQTMAANGDVEYQINAQLVNVTDQSYWQVSAQPNVSAGTQSLADNSTLVFNNVAASQTLTSEATFTVITQAGQLNLSALSWQFTATVEDPNSGDTDSGDTDSGDTDSGDTDSGDTDSGDTEDKKSGSLGFLILVLMLLLMTLRGRKVIQ